MDEVVWHHAVASCRRELLQWKQLTRWQNVGEKVTRLLCEANSTSAHRGAHHREKLVVHNTMVVARLGRETELMAVWIAAARAVAAGAMRARHHGVKAVSAKGQGEASRPTSKKDRPLKKEVKFCSWL